LLWDSGDEGRKRRFTWRGIKLGRIWVGTDTHLANSIAETLMKHELLPELRGYKRYDREVLVEPAFRVDFLLSGTGRQHCFLEVKTSVCVEQGIARFPDSVTPRGLKHLERLTQKCQQGQRAVLLFIVQRRDVSGFTINASRHPAYAEAVLKALAAGVELIALAVEVKPKGFCDPRPLPFV
jgi:sugar fermentation stimulation protein A